MKEKAEELVEKYFEHVTIWDCYNDCPEEPENILEDAKQCAIIAVDEILKQTSVVEECVLFEQYWKGVKEEINKL